MVPQLPFKMAAPSISPRNVTLGEGHNCPCGPVFPRICCIPLTFSCCPLSVDRPCDLPEASPTHTRSSFLKTFQRKLLCGLCSLVKACPVLLQFLESKEATEEQGPLAQPPKGPAATEEHTPFSHGFHNLQTLQENWACFE